jgi:hypothetical protein
MVASCRQPAVCQVPFRNSMPHRSRDNAVLAPMVLMQMLKVKPEVIVSNGKIVARN